MLYSWTRKIQFGVMPFSRRLAVVVRRDTYRGPLERVENGIDGAGVQVGAAAARSTHNRLRHVTEQRRLDDTAGRRRATALWASMVLTVAGPGMYRYRLWAHAQAGEQLDGWGNGGNPTGWGALVDKYAHAFGKLSTRPVADACTSAPLLQQCNAAASAHVDVQ